jgi:hypothetical protein
MTGRHSGPESPQGTDEESYPPLPGQAAISDLEQDPRYRSRGLGRSAAIIFAIVTAVITAAGGVAVALIQTQPWHHDNPCTNNFTITSPINGQLEVSGKNEHIIVKGTACDMSGNTGWLFWRDTDGTYYLEFYNTPPVPTISGDGGWADTITDLGNPGDNDQEYGIAVVLASPTCTSELERAKPDANGDIAFRTLPSGCQIEDNVDVIATYS